MHIGVLPTMGCGYTVENNLHIKCPWAGDIRTYLEGVVLDTNILLTIRHVCSMSQTLV